MSFFTRSKTAFLIAIYFICLNGNATNKSLCEDIFLTSSIPTATWKTRSLEGRIIKTFEYQNSEYYVLMTHLDFKIIHRRSLKTVDSFSPNQLFQNQQPGGGSIHISFDDGILTWQIQTPIISRQNALETKKINSYLTQTASYFFDPRNGLSLKESKEVINDGLPNYFQNQKPSAPFFQFHSEISKKNPYDYFEKIHLPQNQYLIEADSSLSKLYFHSAHLVSNKFEFLSTKELDFSTLPLKIYVTWDGFGQPRYFSDYTSSKLYILMQSTQDKNIYSILSIDLPTATLSISQPIKLASSFSVDSLIVFKNEIHLSGYEKKNQRSTMKTKILSLENKTKNEL